MAKTRRLTASAEHECLILDSGAVIGAARGDQFTRAILTQAHERGLAVEVPVVVLAETVRGQGPRSANVNRVLRKVRIPPTNEETGRLAGALLGDASSSATVDALIVAQAVTRGGAMILTSDPDDLTKLAGGHPHVQIVAV